MNEHTEAINAATKKIMKTGRTVLQLFQLGDSEQEHCEELLHMMDPPEGAIVLDVGCGIGGVARYMKALRPDLAFILLNDNEFQLDQCPHDMPKVQCDMHNTHLPDNVIDVVMVCHTLGYGNVPAAFAEFARILQPGGELFIVDMHGDNPLLTPTLGYRAHTTHYIADAGAEVGLTMTHAVDLGATLDRFQEVIDLDPDSAQQVRNAVEGMQPVVWKLRKGV